MNKQKVRNVILELYNQDSSIVNDEVRLLEQVWVKLGWREDRSLYDNMSRLPRAESVARRRRELYNEGLIKYSDEALEQRTKAFNSEREYQAPKAVSWLYD